MPKARARLAPTTSMMTAPTIARMICVCRTAGVRGGVPRRRGRSASAGAEDGRQRQPDERDLHVVERVGLVQRLLFLDRLSAVVLCPAP